MIPPLTPTTSDHYAHLLTREIVRSNPKTQRKALITGIGYILTITQYTPEQTPTLTHSVLYKLEHDLQQMPVGDLMLDDELQIWANTIAIPQLRQYPELLYTYLCHPQLSKLLEAILDHVSPHGKVRDILLDTIYTELMTVRPVLAFWTLRDQQIELIPHDLWIQLFLARTNTLPTLLSSMIVYYYFKDIYKQGITFDKDEPMLPTSLSAVHLDLWELLFQTPITQYLFRAQTDIVCNTTPSRRILNTILQEHPSAQIRLTHDYLINHLGVKHPDISDHFEKRCYALLSEGDITTSAYVLGYLMDRHNVDERWVPYPLITL